MTQQTGLEPKYRTLLPLFDELRGERAIVRLFREEDAVELFRALDESRRHLRPWIPASYVHETLDATRDWINRQRAAAILRDAVNCAILDAATGRLAGGVNAKARNWDIRWFEMGYWLRPDASGHGYATEAASLLEHFLFDEWHARRVELRCDERNAASIAVARRLGFPLEGIMRNEYLDADGIPRDTLIFAKVIKEGV